MSERTLFPIFIFWVLLTFITPTLILLSENSRADFNLNGNTAERMKARKVMDYTDNHGLIAPPTMALVEAEEPASVPASPPAPPLLTPSLGTGRADLTRSYQNHTLRRNSTDSINQTKTKNQIDKYLTTTMLIEPGFQHALSS